MRAATDGKGVVDGDGRARAGVSYPSVGAVADCLVGLGRITCHGFSVAHCKSKSTEGRKQLRYLGAGGPLRSESS